MGASGAGKTTMLNVISGRLHQGSSSDATDGKPIVEGEIQLNGRNVSHRVDILKRLAAFVEQDDVFPGFLTVEEHLWFHAKLRMTKFGTTDKQRRRRIDALMMELNLMKVASTTIGVPELGMKTLSGGERKRLSVATELISNPPLLLLDEPTSGLDSFMSENVVSSLRLMAQSGKTVAFTIHQPSSELFNYFDRLLLLSEGRICFHGDAKDAAVFFSEAPINKPCPISYNPADFYIEILSKPMKLLENNNADDEERALITNTMELHSSFLGKAFSESRFGRMVTLDVKQVQEKAEREMGSIEDLVSGQYVNLVQPRASNFEQLKWCTWRSVLSFYRSPQWMRIRIIEVIVFSILYGLMFFQLSTSPTDISNRNGLLAQLISLNCWDNLDAYALTLPFDRPFLVRDESAGLYSLSAYFFGRQFVELPLLFTLSAVQTAAIALFANLWGITSPDKAFDMIAACFLTGLNASSMGYFVGFVSDNIAIQVNST